MLTRGRTGSTAILDEIGTTNVFSLQELFTDRISEEQQGALIQNENNILPFEIWMEPAQNTKIFNELDIDRKTFFSTLKKRFDQALKSLIKCQPVFRNNNYIIGRLTERYFLIQYLEYIERIARGMKKDGIIFKVLSHQITSRRPLLGALKLRGYKAILLIRRNVVRQVLSGMIAEQRGVYNTKQVKSLPSCVIDLDRFEFSVAWELKCNEENRALLKGNGIEYIEIAYEDFCRDRENLYRNMFSFMNIGYQSPQSTNYSVMIPDIQDAIKNIKELESKISAMFSLY